MVGYSPKPKRQKPNQAVRGEAGIMGLAETLALPTKMLGFRDETLALTATGPGKSGVGAWSNQGRRNRRSRW